MTEVIVKNPEVKEITFSEIKVGCVFRLKRGQYIFVKVKTSDEVDNCRSLQDLTLHTLDEDDIVEVAKKIEITF